MEGMEETTQQPKWPKRKPKRIRRADRDYPTLILAERKRRGQTQAAAASDLGTTVTTISNWECGVRRPCGLYQDAVEIWLVGGKSL